MQEENTSMEEKPTSVADAAATQQRSFWSRVKHFFTADVETTTAAEKDMQYFKDIHQAMLTEGQSKSWILLAILSALLVCALLWAGFKTVEEVTQSTGRVVPSSREQIIQSLEGGLIEEFFVREGDTVEKGEKLLSIDPTKAQSSYSEGQNKVLALEATAARLRAESRGTGLNFPAAVREQADFVASEQATYRARKQATDDAIRGLGASRDLAQRELSITEPMARKGLVAEVEVLKLRRQMNEINIQISDRRNRYRADAANELVKVESELSQVSENVVARQDQLSRTILRAPLRGIVKNLRFSTVGGVVQPAQEILDIVPLEETLLVEVKIRPGDVAFLKPGMDAMVKISAYDYSIYGGLKGKLEQISPDTIREKDPVRPGEEASYYRALVRTNQPQLVAAGKSYPILPGMTAVVDIRTGEKTVLSYLLKPVRKVNEALRER